jgi:ferredoxin
VKVHIKIGVDGGQQGCTGHGRCAVAAGEFYNVDDEGYNIYRGKTVDVPEGFEELARYGAQACPERAIRIED